MNNSMQQRLLNTLDVLQASEKVTTQVKEEALRPGIDVDLETGEYLGEPPEGYRPMVEPPPITVSHKDSKVPEFEQSDVTTDYKRVRDTSYAVQEATLFMMEQAAKLAVETEAPRAFTMFKELGELMRGLNKDIMENQKMYKEVTKGVEPPIAEESTVEVTTNPDGSVKMTVGKQARSSRDILKAIEEAQQAKEERRSKLKNGEQIIDVEPESAGSEEVKEEDNGSVSEA